MTSLILRGSELGEKNSAGEAEWHGEDERDGGSDQGAVDEGCGAEIIEDGVPDFGPEKRPAELGAREMRISPEFVHEHGCEQEDNGGKCESDEVSDFIALAKAMKKRTRSGLRRNLVRDSGGSCGHFDYRLLDQRDCLSLPGDNFFR